jgi:hypothetical protein
MGVYFSFLAVVIIECIHVVIGQCPATHGPVVIVGTSIAENAYQSCANITSVEIPSTVVVIGK